MNMERIRELAWTDYLLCAVTDPRELYRRIKQAGKDILPWSFAIPALCAFFDIIIISLSGRQTLFFYYRISYGWLLVFLLLLVKTLVYSSLIDTSSQFFGHKGNVRETVTLVNLSLFPRLFFLPLYYVITIAGFMPGFFYVFLGFVFFCWFIFILVQGLSEMNSITSGRALAIIVMPAVLAAVVFFFIVVVLAITLMGYIAS